MSTQEGHEYSLRGMLYRQREQTQKLADRFAKGETAATGESAGSQTNEDTGQGSSDDTSTDQ